MKKWFAIIIIIALSILAGRQYFKIFVSKTPSSDNVLSAVKTPSITPTLPNQTAIIYLDGNPIYVSWAEVAPEQGNLYSNIKDQQLSEQIKAEKSCQILVNGGFYSKENTHLGLFITNSEIISKEIKNDTLNGFMWINGKSVFIKSFSPNIIPNIALQSGPLLMQNDQPLSLEINNDEQNRRIVAATTIDNKLFFLVFYNGKSDFEGPLLGQLPVALDLFKKQTGIKIIDAINLDGGSASVFISNYVQLRELTYVGSYFCIK